MDEKKRIKVDFPGSLYHGKIFDAVRWWAPFPAEQWCWKLDVPTPDGDILPYAIHESRGHEVINVVDRPVPRPKATKAKKK